MTEVEDGREIRSCGDMRRSEALMLLTRFILGVWGTCLNLAFVAAIDLLITTDGRIFIEAKSALIMLWMWSPGLYGGALMSVCDSQLSPAHEPADRLYDNVAYTYIARTCHCLTGSST